MGILFSEIYTKAVALFDDPQITKAYQFNRVLFEKKMYTYLQNAIAMFNNPLIISTKLSNHNLPEGVMETFEGNGEAQDFEIGFNIDEGKKYNYVFMEQDIAVLEGVTLSKDEGTGKYTVHFPDILPEGQLYSVEQYYCGEFTDNFFNITNGNVGQQAVINYTKDILARLLVKSWAEEERNLLLEIRGIMQDSDFKLLSSDRILKSKNEWVNQLDSEIYNYQNRLAWQIRFMNGSSKLGRG